MNRFENMRIPAYLEDTPKVLGFTGVATNGLGNQHIKEPVRN